MPVLIEEPLSFDIEKFLIAHPIIKNVTLSVLDPRTGHEIFGTLVNIPEIGITSQPTPNRKKLIGFPGMTSSSTPLEEDSLPPDDSSCPAFEPEAILVLDAGDIKLPQGNEQAWILQVKHQKDEALYTQVAVALSKNFNDVTIMITCAYKKNDDPNCVDGIPVNPKFKKGPFFCPIGITRAQPVKAAIDAQTKME